MLVAAAVRKKRVGRNRCPGAGLWGLNDGGRRRGDRTWRDMGDTGGGGVARTEMRTGWWRLVFVRMRMKPGSSCGAGQRRGVTVWPVVARVMRNR